MLLTTPTSSGSLTLAGHVLPPPRHGDARRSNAGWGVDAIVQGARFPDALLSQRLFFLIFFLVPFAPHSLTPGFSRSILVVPGQGTDAPQSAQSALALQEARPALEHAQGPGGAPQQLLPPPPTM